MYRSVTRFRFWVTANLEWIVWLSRSPMVSNSSFAFGQHHHCSYHVKDVKNHHIFPHEIMKSSPCFFLEIMWNPPFYPMNSCEKSCEIHHSAGWRGLQGLHGLGWSAVGSLCGSMLNLGDGRRRVHGDFMVIREMEDFHGTWINKLEVVQHFVNSIKIHGGFPWESWDLLV